MEDDAGAAGTFAQALRLFWGPKKYEQKRGWGFGRDSEFAGDAEEEQQKKKRWLPEPATEADKGRLQQQEHQQEPQQWQQQPAIATAGSSNSRQQQEPPAATGCGLPITSGSSRSRQQQGPTAAAGADSSSNKNNSKSREQQGGELLCAVLEEGRGLGQHQDADSSKMPTAARADSSKNNHY